MSDQHPRHALNDMHNPDNSDHPELAIYGVAPASSPRSLVDILRATITAHPDVAAIEAADGAITYGELESILDAEAVRLAGLGVTRGSRPLRHHGPLRRHSRHDLGRRRLRPG